MLKLRETTIFNEILSSVDPEASISIQGKSETQPRRTFQKPQVEGSGAGFLGHRRHGPCLIAHASHQESIRGWFQLPSDKEFCFQQEQLCRFDLKGFPKNREGIGNLYLTKTCENYVFSLHKTRKYRTWLCRKQWERCYLG